MNGGTKGIKAEIEFLCMVAAYNSFQEEKLLLKLEKANTAHSYF
jgi:hypothetical protein